MRFAAFPLPLRPDAVPPGPGSGRLVFAFDLDGTVTRGELLPRIARLAGLEAEMAELTRRTLCGEIPFEASFRKRFAMLRHLPLDAVRESLAEVEMDPHIEDFLARRREDCVIVTGNLDVWVAPLLERLGCRFFASRGTIRAGRVELVSVLDKGRAADALLAEGRRIVAVGESVNDAPLFRKAFVGVAFAGVHRPVPEIRRLARHEAADGASLCGVLDSLVAATNRKIPDFL